MGPVNRVGMVMPIKFDCTYCGRSLTVPVADAGLIALCNACGHRLFVPEGPPLESSAPPFDAMWSVVEAMGEEGGEEGVGPEDTVTDFEPIKEDVVAAPADPLDTTEITKHPVPPPPWLESRPWEGPVPWTGRSPSYGSGRSALPAAVEGAPLPPARPEPAPIRQRGRRHLDAAQWTFVGAVGLSSMLLVLVVVLLSSRRADVREASAWDAAHRADIRAIIDEADSRVIVGNLRGARESYARLDAFIAGHHVTDAALRAELDRVESQRQKVAAALAERILNEGPVASPAPPPPTAVASSGGGRLTPVARGSGGPGGSSSASSPPQGVSGPDAVKAEVAKSAAPVVPVAQPRRTVAVARSVLKVSRQPVKPTDLDDEKIGRSIERGSKWLAAQFDQTGILRGEAGGVRNGLDALCVYALLQCGQATHDEQLDIHAPLIKRLLTRLNSLKMDEEYETYGRAIRATALALNNRPQDAGVLRADLYWLLRGHKDGGYSYNEKASKTGSFDNSNSQYGLLGVWSAAEAGLAVSGGYWKQVEDHWMRQQSDTGAWGYTGPGGDSLAMTVAGVASLFVTHDYLEPAQFAERVGRAPFSPQLARGLKWLETGDNLAVAGAPGYTIYGIERTGLASGFKFFGAHDWYRQIARDVIARQQADGSWGDPIETCYNLLFLARGRHPIVMNKLRFDGAWANRPRDVANLARFASRELERPLNWQVVSADRPWTDWADAPILYLASHTSPKITNAQAEQIRRFVEAGGLLFTQADGGKSEFDQYAHELAKKLFPQFEMEPLPMGHELYTVVFPMDKAVRPPLMAVSNGARLLMIHSPADLAMRWQQRAEKEYPAHFQFGVNLFIYAGGKDDLRNRIASTSIPEPDAAGGGSIKIARIRHAANWDPEPAAWARFARWFTHETDCQANVVVLDLDALGATDCAVAHLSSSGPFSASESEIAAIQRYVDRGGTVLVEACNGSEPARQSITETLSRAFPDASLKPLAVTDPLFSIVTDGMEDLGSHPMLRPYATSKLGKNAGGLEGFSHGKGHVILAPIDVTVGLLGAHPWGIVGYEPAYAQSLVKNVLLWTAAGCPSLESSAGAR